MQVRAWSLVACIVLVLIGGCGGRAPELADVAVTPSAAGVDESAPPASQSDPGIDEQDQPGAQEPEHPSEEAEPAQEPGGDEKSLAPPQPGIPIPEGATLIPCPDPNATMLLKFSANMQVKTEEAVITHILHDGILFLDVVPGNGGTVGIASSVGDPIPYDMNGTMRDCTLQGSGTMTPSATGYCQDGVVYLTVIEDWGPYQGTLTCPDAQVPMTAPSMGQQTHSGADGRGELFFLDANFSAEGAGYTTIRPYAGPMGQGDHIWTLFYEYLGPVKP